MYILLNNTLSHCLKVEAILHQIKQLYFEHFILYCWYGIQYCTIINLQLHRFLYFSWYEIFLHNSITFIPFDRQRGKESKPKYGLSRTLKSSTTQFLNGTSSSFYFMMRSCCIIRVHIFVILIAQKPLRIWYSYFL